ncbi:pyridoxamine 5'-phosphate oxidase family protein, partial [Litoreibacter sp.]|nr:pyridoxamine 5'-phosphate oxidase family protein [Litoreibacter sp.]
MDYIKHVDELEAIYGAPGEASLVKVARQMTPMYRKWIMASRLCVLSTVGPDGTDGSPRGDDGPVVRELDAHTLAMPDWRGNNRMDSLRNIVVDGRVALMFFVPGSNNVVRVNGMARVTVDADLCGSFAQRGQHPRSV